MVVREATPEDRESIAEIWRACFTDDEDYIHKYLNYCFPYTNTWILGDNRNDIYSCASIIPSYALIKGEKIHGGYLYGVGTLANHRGNSYSRTIIGKAADSLKLKGGQYLLVKPATSGLFDLYKGMGFDKELFKASYTRGIANVDNINKAASNLRYKKITGSLKELTLEDLARFREDQLSKTYFMWSLPILRYALSEALSRNGNAFYFEKTAIEGQSIYIYAIGYPEESDVLGNTFKILETNANTSDDFEDICSVLHHIGSNNTTNISVDSPSCIHEKLPYFKLERAALYMELTAGVSKSIGKLHLSLPME